MRCLPADNALPQQFIDLWNLSKGDQAKAWNFVYDKILYVYDMLFNVMLEYVHLGSQQAFAAARSAIWNAISEESFQESTYAMPITRDLSEGKRLVLQLYIYILDQESKVTNLAADTIPKGWKPKQQARPR